MNAIISLSDLVTTDAEPRVLDLRLSEALGFERPRKIRDLITRNMAEIEAHGPAPHRGALVERPQGGTVEVTEYWLNEPQALLVCMFARTARAAEVRKNLIEVFMAWRRGQLPDAAPILEAFLRAEIPKRIAAAGGIMPSRDLALTFRWNCTYADVHAVEDRLAEEGQILVTRMRRTHHSRVPQRVVAISNAALMRPGVDTREGSPVTTAIRAIWGANHALHRSLCDLARELGVKLA